MYYENINILTFLRILVKSPMTKLQNCSLKNYNGKIINVLCDYEFDTSFDLGSDNKCNFL